MSEWLFLTNQARVLLYIARHPSSTARKIAQAVGITERATQRLIRDLDEAGYITRKRVGRHNEYVIHGDRPVTGDVVGRVPVKALIDCLGRQCDQSAFIGDMAANQAGPAAQPADG